MTPQATKLAPKGRPSVREEAISAARDFAILMNARDLDELSEATLSELKARHVARRLPETVAAFAPDETGWSPQWLDRQKAHTELKRIHAYLHSDVVRRIDHPAGWVTADEASHLSSRPNTPPAGVRMSEGLLRETASGGEWRLSDVDARDSHRGKDTGSYIDLVDAAKTSLDDHLKSPRGDVLVYAICRALGRWPWQRCFRCHRVYAFQRMGSRFCSRTCSLDESNEKLRAKLSANPDLLEKYRDDARKRMKALNKAKHREKENWKPKRRRQPRKD